MQTKAIINCRVSTLEQLQSNSLNRQLTSVEKAAKKLGAIIPDDGRWSGSVSSKAGTNVTRKDLLEMLEYCKKHRSVKYAIFDEYDRYMRSVNEGPYFEVLFQQLGVKVWYASESDAFNGDDAMAKFMRSMSAYKAEGSNEERQRKSITGHRGAINQGRYTFIPKPGYIKSDKPGVHIPHPELFKPLQKSFKEVASKLYTPTEALKRLNQSEFTKHHAPWKMDKFRKFAPDPYYAGILEIKKQVSARCQKGQHEPMLTIEEHELLVQIFSNKRARINHQKHYNPQFPLNNLLLHDCVEGAKFTGSIKSNGHGGYYPKYHCRRCGKQYKRELIHEEMENTLSQLDYDDVQRDRFIAALSKVYTEKQQDNLNHIQMLTKRLHGLEEEKSKLVREYAKASETMQTDLLPEIDKVKLEIQSVTDEKESFAGLQKDFVEFIKFALEYTNKAKDDWWLMNREERLQCQQIIFPGGITFNSSRKVGTTDICPLYRLAAIKKDLRESRKSLLVELEGIAPSSTRF